MEWNRLANATAGGTLILRRSNETQFLKMVIFATKDFTFISKTTKVG